MTFIEYVLFKKPIGSNRRIRHLVVKYRVNENSELNGRLDKRSVARIIKLQVKYKRRNTYI